MSRIDYWASDSTYEFVLEKASEFFEHGQYADALAMYQSLMASGVDSDIYYEAARCYHKLGKFQQASVFFEKSLQLNNRRWNGYCLLADCYYQLKDFPKAIYNATCARSLKPDELQGVLNLAKYHSAQNMIFEEMYYYNRFLQISNDKRNEDYRSISRKLSEARSNSDRISGTAYRAFIKKDIRTAYQNYTQAFMTYPISYDTNYNLGLINRDLRNHKEAIKYFMQALFLNQRENKIYMHIASEYSKLADYTRAYCFIKRFINSILPAPNQADYLSAMKNLKALEPHINKGFSPSIEIFMKNNNYLQAFYELENALLISETPDKKLEFEKLESLVFPEKSMSKLYINKGAELYNAGKFGDANRFFTRVMEISTKDSEEYKFAKARISYV